MRIYSAIEKSKWKKIIIIIKKKKTQNKEIDIY